MMLSNARPTRYLANKMEFGPTGWIGVVVIHYLVNVTGQGHAIILHQRMKEGMIRS